jgi:hypothetical protein
MTIEYVAGNNWRLRTTGAVGLTKKYLEVAAVKQAPPPDPDIAAQVTSWKECLDFSGVPPCPTP